MNIKQYNREYICWETNDASQKQKSQKSPFDICIKDNEFGEDLPY